jgi:hypothetical protein
MNGQEHNFGSGRHSTQPIPSSSSMLHCCVRSPEGDPVIEGEQLGTHIGPQTMSDIAVGYSLGNSWRLLSYFSLMSDSLFAHYVQRGIASRNDVIISATERNADPLNCSGETFGSNGTIENWITLK